MGRKPADKATQFWRLNTVLLILVAALLVAAIGFPEYAAGLLVVALPVAVVALVIIRYHRSALEDWQSALEQQLPIDRETGAATQVWFKQVLEQECRRATREFTPLSVVRLIPVKPETSFHTSELVAQLHERMTRPGDLVAVDTAGALTMLLPATNEGVVKFSDRIFHLFNEKTDGAHLVGYTFQPVADLNTAKVFDILTQLHDRTVGVTEPKLIVESEGFDMPSVTYSI